MRLLAFSGYARAGKDTAADALAPEWKRVAFADNVREFLYRLNPLLEAGDYECRVADVIRQHTWNGYKNTVYGDEIRSLLQRVGVECGRNILGENVWVNAALENLADENYVVTDCRFPNEADGIRARGGKIFRILRTGIGPANSHMSETALDDYDFDGYVHNDSTREAFYASVRRVAETFDTF